MTLDFSIRRFRTRRICYALATGARRFRVNEPWTLNINSGTFLVVVGDGNIGLRGTGSYRLTLARTGAAIAVSPGDESGLLSPGVRDGTIDLGDLDIYFSATNITTPFPLWVPILTNQFGAFGEFSFTNQITPGVPEQFFRLCVP